MKKLWHVEVSKTVDLAVYAEDKDDARQLGLKIGVEAMNDLDCRVDCKEVTSQGRLKACLAKEVWGEPPSHEKEDRKAITEDGEVLTATELLDRILEWQRLEVLRLDLERRQVKLFPA